MKKLFILSAILTVISSFISADIYGQAFAQPCSMPAAGSALTLNNNATSQSVMAKNGMTATPKNYTSFTQPYKSTGTEAKIANAGYESNPESGLLFPGTPCDNCYELIGKRTETTKTFVKNGTSGTDGGKDIMVQTSTAPMHYHDAHGNWLTIKTQLEPDVNNKGVYAANEQPVPVVINTSGTNKFSSLGKSGENFQFNRNLELIYVKQDGSEVSLGMADWTNHTAGDDGVYIKNAWPGIDIEMYVLRGAVKTNFLIKNAMPAYADGNLLLRDHQQMDKGLSLVATSGGKQTDGTLEVKNAAGEQKYVISVASVSEHSDYKNTLKFLWYNIGDNNTLDITLPGSYLNKPASAYPIIIDPLVTQNTTTTVNGSSYNAAWAALMGCAYPNAATAPPNCTITDIQFQFAFTSTIPMDDCAFSFYMNGGTCRSPGTAAAGQSWSCGPPAGTAAGTCTSTGGANYSIFTNMQPCLPAPACTPPNLNITMYFYYDNAANATCATTYCYGSAPLIITVIGHTVEMGGNGGITATPATICAGATSSLSASGVYGVPPYVLTWAPGVAATGSPVTVLPTATTTYTVTVTDACGITATATKAVTVNPVATITGPTVVCAGNMITLSDGGVAGAWSSVTATVATITAAGVVTGVAAGTDVIRYTSTTGGCIASYTITVTPLPGPIGGTTSVCVGSTTTLNNSAAGGAWTSSNTAVATIDPATGVVSGVTPGNTTITYSLGGSCTVTTNVTVNQVDPVTGTLTLCLGSTTALSDATTGGTWSSGSPTVATIGATSGVVYSVATGTATMTYTSLTGCTATANVTVNLLAPITGNTTICAGITTTLNDVATPGTWSSSNPPVATIDATGDLSGLSGGTATITFFTPLGCSATTLVTVNPLPDISSVSSTNPTTCGGSDGSITLNGLTPGTSYSVNYTFNGTPAAALTITATGGSQVLINIPSTGLLYSGYYTAITVTDAATGCSSNIVNATLQDPLPPPPPVITSNQPICVGQTLLLAATDAVQGGTYSWTGPNGFTSADQDPTIVNTSAAASGFYTVTYTLWNCPSPTTANISSYPPILLTNLTASQTIPYGNSIQLNADGALYYMWTPNNGTLNNPNINNPIATPQITTAYTVYGTNLAGCEDSATITISIDSTTAEFVPSAFSPNGDGLNDVFRIVNINFQKLVEFNVYNRWGQMLYHNTYDPKQGWDGTFNGVPQDIGVYNYSITVITAEGSTRYYKGDVTLIR